MRINKVLIDNFKSIDKLEIPFDKVSDSYTKIFVGINESGKSNILEALSYLDIPKEKCEYNHFCNQKTEDDRSCSIYYYLDLEDIEQELLNKKIKSLISSDKDIDFKIANIYKNVFLVHNSTQFLSYYLYSVSFNNNLFFKKSLEKGKMLAIVDEEHKTDGCEKMTNEIFKTFFNDIVEAFIKEHEPKVSVWKSSNKDLLYNVNLKMFKNNISSNKPLYNIFKLSGFENDNAIINAIDKATSPSNRSRLSSKLTKSLSDYINKVWDNKIDLIIDITEMGNFSILIKDKGEENVHDRFSISERSQGAQHFLSIILSLSLAANNHERKNELILIDEPEVHLHPSGIRDLSKELLKIGQDNYVFLATHSPFMIDKKNKERHFIVKKNQKAISEVFRIKESDNLIDDEVLRDAFGMDVYKDLLNPHSILVEGSTDKIILYKAFECLGHKNIGITNGHGSNITTLVSKLNFDDMSILVVLDDDDDGRKDKEKILKVGGLYTTENVFTIRDLVGEIVDNGTIEDTLDRNFVISQFKKFYKSKYNEDINFQPQSTQSIIQQVIELLKQKEQNFQWIIDSFKKQLSEEFKPSKTSLESKNILLKELAEKIVEKLNK